MYAEITNQIRLFAAIVQSPASRGRSHPFGMHPRLMSVDFLGLAEGWVWLARAINSGPVIAGVSPLAIQAFIQVAGPALSRQFGRQFHKLILCLRDDLVPDLEKV